MRTKRVHLLHNIILDIPIYAVYCKLNETTPDENQELQLYQKIELARIYYHIFEGSTK